MTTVRQRRRRIEIGSKIRVTAPHRIDTGFLCQVDEFVVDEDGRNWKTIATHLRADGTPWARYRGRSILRREDFEAVEETAQTPPDPTAGAATH